MSALDGRRVVLGVCGGIAAYKVVDVCRRLMDAGAHVVPVMTEGATRFVGPTTFSALASEPVRLSLWDDRSAVIPHTELGRSADIVVVAPATARLLSAYAAGYSHDLLTNLLLATRAPVLVCPAMHTEMWEHPAVQDNMAALHRRGVHVIGPDSGRLAGGDVGAGRLAEPVAITAAVEALVGGGRAGDMSGLSVLVTAGGTREAIDPVRFLGNRSSGKQGHAIADEAAARGAKVVLVTTTNRPCASGVERIEVESAQEMHDEVMARAGPCDVVVMAAAVADFTPVVAARDKLKKRAGVPVLELRETVDILAALGSSKAEGQILVGFAAETDDLERNARNKLQAKGADLVVANDVGAGGAGFEHDTNEVLILSAGGLHKHVLLTDKRSVAREILDTVVELRAGNG